MTRKNRISALAVVVALAALAALPASANNVPRTGGKIGLLCVYLGTCPAEQSYAADTPFYVAHGWSDVTDNWQEIVDPDSHFELLIDGERVPMATDLELGLGRDPASVSKTNVANMRHGLPAGIYTFVGRWYGADGNLAFEAVKTVTFS
jgi:hypothetical protein